MTDLLQIVEHDNLSIVLEQLTAFGKPSLFFLPGWHCKVAMNTTSNGVSFDVASGFGMPTALSAAAMCLYRAKDALQKADYR